MDEPSTQTSHARRPSGRDAKRAARAARAASSIPYITRKIPYYEVLSEEGLELIEHNADTILEEIGIDFRDDAEALQIWKAAGADVQGERVHFPRGMCRTLVQKTAPREFTQHARNPARNVVIGGKNTVFAPAYGSPFVRSLDEGRRYARIEDFRNFVKLAYMSTSLASFGRHDLRARRSAGQQAASRHGVQPSEVQRQAVHGLGHGAAARRRFGRDGKHRVRRRAQRPAHRPAEDDHHQSDQRQFADDLRCHHARRRQGLRARQSGAHHHARSFSRAPCRR